MDAQRFRPPVLVGERVVWLGSGSGIPQGGTVKWIGKLAEMGADWTLGLELDNQLPYGGIDGTWGNRCLFACKPKHGMLVPIATTLREKDLFKQLPVKLPESTLQYGKGDTAAHPDNKFEQEATPQRPQRPQRQKNTPQSPQQEQQQPQQQEQQRTLQKQHQEQHQQQPVHPPRQKHQQHIRQRPPTPAPPPRTPTPPTPPEQELPSQQQVTSLARPELFPFSQQQFTSLQQQLPSLQQQIPSPEQQHPSPQQQLPPPQEQLPFLEQLISPQQQLPVPQHQLPTPEQQFESSQEQLQPQQQFLQPQRELQSPDTESELESDSDSISLLEPELIRLLSKLRSFTDDESDDESTSAGEHDQPVTSHPQPAQRRKKDKPPLRPSRAKPPAPAPCRYDTLTSITSGEYQWYDADEELASDFWDCRSTFYETLPVTKSGFGVRVQNGVSKDDSLQTQIMNNVHDTNLEKDETAVVNDSAYSEKCKNNSFNRSSASYTGSGSRREKTNSGFFSFLRWFRKGRDEDDGDEELKTPTATAPSSPELVRSHNSSCGSIDTLFSTATVSSFAFISPHYYRPFGAASQPEKCIAVGADTDTYKNRLRYLNRARELDKNLTLKKKYRLYASESLSTIATPNSSPLLRPKLNGPVQSSPGEQRRVNLTPSPGSHNSTFGRKKRRAPPPPNLPKSHYSDYSLPSTLESKAKLTNGSMNNDEPASAVKSHHRRCASESYKDRKAGAYCHVKGKRKAPSPPKLTNDVAQTNGESTEKLQTPVNSVGRKKRLAPLPPVNGKEEVNKRKVNKETQAGVLEESANKTTINKLSPAERDRLIANIAKLKAHADRRSMGSPPSSPHFELRSTHHEHVVCNDTLKLERGVLKPNREMSKVEAPVASVVETKVAPVSPRPWYKRSLTKSDSSGSSTSSSGGGLLKIDLFKSLEKKRDKEREKDEEWMPEVGIARASYSSTTSETSTSSVIGSRFNIFSRLDRSEEKRKDGEKRKSQISMLANISELDREAAEIVQKEQERESAMLEARHAQFYSYPDMPGMPKAPPVEEQDSPKRSSARELISLFNAIGHVTKVTVNTSFFKDGTSIFSKDGVESRISTEEKVVVTETATAGASAPPESSVVITEVEDDVERTSKAQALYEANKSRRHRSPSPSVPTIAEQSESVSSATTTPASTNSNRSSAHVEVDFSKQLWVCPRCTLENPRWKITCDACGKWRPITGETPPTTTPGASDKQETKIKPSISSPPISTSSAILPASATPKAKSGINWEEELKRYLPDTKSPTASPKLAPARKNIVSETKQQDQIHENGIDLKSQPSVKTASSTQTEAKKVPITSQKSIDTSVQKGEEVVKKTLTVGAPSTFIGGKLKQDELKAAAAVKEVKQNEKKASATVRETGEKIVVGGNGPAIEETDVDELRKARLAFFHKPAERNSFISEGVQAGTEPVDSAKKPIDENERLKLREMLKEMRNSLPKRPKNNGSQESNDNKRNSTQLDNSDIFKQIETSAIPLNRNSVLKDDSQTQGAVKKVPVVKKEEPPPNSSAADNEKAEALFITKTTVYENIKVKKTDGSKPVKVSTSAQTSGIVRKIEPAGSGNKPPSGRPLNAEPSTNPLVGDYIYAGIKDGVLYTSVNAEARRIGKGMFELIRARDFKSIEVVKAGLESGTTHVYANMPSSPGPPVTASQLKGVLPQQPSASAPQEVAPALPSSPPVHRVEAESGPDSSDQWSSATDSPVPPSPGGGRRHGGSEASSYSAASTRSDSSEVERLTAQLTLPKGLADFKATLASSSPEQNMNTLSVNRLLRRLEAAIAGGQHTQAAGLAKELARMKISCSVTRQRRSLDSSPAAITVDMYVEDKVSHQGPLPLQVTPTMTVAQLKVKVEQEFEIPSGVQRWILGKMLASDDSKTLEEHNVNSNGCPMFLYLVAPEGDQESDASSSVGQSEPTEPEPPPDEVRSGAAPPGKGWYYNYEEDRYSYCEDSDEDLSEEEMEEMRIHSPTKETPAPNQRPVNKIPVVQEEDEEEEEDEEYEEIEESDEEDGAAGNVVVVNNKPVVIQDPGVAGGVKPTAPPQTLKPTAPPQPNEAALLVENKTGTLKIGWQCPVCTLMNSPTRPGCAACTTERPQNYVVPIGYRANEQELQRLNREQQLEEDMQKAADAERQKAIEEQHQHYLQLVNLEKADLVPNLEAFDCSVCLAPYGPRDGVVLRECLHTFCKPCLVNTVQFSEEAEVQCPYRDANYACQSVLQDREIKSLVPPKVYEQHLAKSVAQAENKIRNAFHCKTPDCRGWCIFEDNLNEFRCPVCMKTNCLTCQVIHDGMNCKQYQEHVKQESETNAEARRTKDLLEEMVDRGEAMKCPTCQVVLMKKWGCDWLRCSMCKTEICWVTRGPRWGPGGKGDTTGGCQCGVNGIKCHPKCNYCH